MEDVVGVALYIKLESSPHPLFLAIGADSCRLRWEDKSCSEDGVTKIRVLPAVTACTYEIPSFASFPPCTCACRC